MVMIVVGVVGSRDVAGPRFHLISDVKPESWILNCSEPFKKAFNFTFRLLFNVKMKILNKLKKETNFHRFRIKNTKKKKHNYNKATIFAIY